MEQGWNLQGPSPASTPSRCASATDLTFSFVFPPPLLQEGAAALTVEQKPEAMAVLKSRAEEAKVSLTPPPAVRSGVLAR